MVNYLAFKVLERSHSGLVRTLGKRVNPKGFRGFESPPLRHEAELTTFARFMASHPPSKKVRALVAWLRP